MNTLLRYYRQRHIFAFVSSGLMVMLLLSGCILGPSLTPIPTAGVTSNEKVIQVLVLDDKEQQPLPQVDVMLNIADDIFPSERTDSSGRAVFEVREQLLQKVATFAVQKDGYQIQTYNVTLANARVLTIYLVPIGATAVPRETSTNTPMPPTPQPDDTNTPMPTNTAVPTNTPTVTATQTPTPASDTNTITVMRREGAGTVYVLAGPDVSNVSLGTLAVDESGEVIGRSSGSEWLQIVTNRGVQGWVADCEVTLSSANLATVPITWEGLVTAKDCAGESPPGEPGPIGSCVTISLVSTELPTRSFDDVLLSWSNVPSTATRLRLWVTGLNEDGEIAFVIDPTFSDVDVSYKVEVFKFEEGDFVPQATYTYVVQPFNAANEIICTTQGTFVP